MIGSGVHFASVFDVRDYPDLSLLREYLSQWSEYESLERAEECYKLARPLGPLLSAYSVAQCIGSGMPGDEQSIKLHFEDCLEDSDRYLEHAEKEESTGDAEHSRWRAF